MRATPLVLLIIVIQLAGCSSTLIVAPGRTSAHGDTVTVSDLERKISGRSVIISVAGDSSFVARDIVLTKDSCSFIKEGESERESFDLRQCTRLTRKDHLAGGWSGVLLGGLGGFAIGGAFASMGEGGGGEMGGLRVVPIVFGGAVGAIVGGVIGAIVGNSFNYEFAFDAPGIYSSARDSNSVKQRGK